jgi:hypothetical protein
VSSGIRCIQIIHEKYSVSLEELSGLQTQSRSSSSKMLRLSALTSTTNRIERAVRVKKRIDAIEGEGQGA